MLWDNDRIQEELSQQNASDKIMPMPSNLEQLSTFLRIHGDNILECERALFLIAEAFQAHVRMINSPPYLPRFEIFSGDKILYTVDLLSGHKRWNFDLQNILKQHGAPLREATDAVVTEVLTDIKQEKVKCAFEFCNALPAGNNAWQRNGRALACATVGIPYMYFADIGGVELDANRNVKASRFPNPIVPFSYITVGKSFDMMCVPVYLPSPSSVSETQSSFNDAFGEKEGLQLVRQIIEGNSTSDTYKVLIEKAMLAVEKLTSRRSRTDTLQGNGWRKLLDIKDADNKVEWLKQNAPIWVKRSVSKVEVSETFKHLVSQFSKIQFISIGAQDIPICLVHKSQRATFAAILTETYQKSLSEDFTKWLASKSSSLVIVWITGFKPGGDDSRPDRGLVPMARMLFGNDIDLLSIVYGPGPLNTWKLLESIPQKLADENGLWEPIINLSDGVLADSIKGFPVGLLLTQNHQSFHDTITFPLTSSLPVFSEMDIDSTLHLLFARQEESGVFECLCNPPGGDWSGLSIFDNFLNQEFRWTSLPRVSGQDGKRPDHVIQFFSDDAESVLVAIESKDRGNQVEENVGDRLKLYVQKLVQSAPTITKQVGHHWEPWTTPSNPLPKFSAISAGAFQWNRNGLTELNRVLTRSRLDIVFAVEFNNTTQSSIIHIKANPSAICLLPKINQLAQHFGTRLKVQIH